MAIGLLGAVLLEQWFREPPPHRPESFAAIETETIANEKLFSVNRKLWGNTRHFYYEDYDSGRLFRSSLPAQINLNLFSVALPLGGGGLSKTHIVHGITQDIRTRYVWSRVFTDDEERGVGEGNELYFDNASDENLTIVYNSIELPVIPPKSHALVFLEFGDHHFVIRDDRQVIDEMNVAIEDGNDYLFYIYNVNSINSYGILSQRYGPN